MKAWLEGHTPARRSHHAVEVAAVVMSAASCSEVVLRVGGLGVMKINVDWIEANGCARRNAGHPWTPRSVCDGDGEL